MTLGKFLSALLFVLAVYILLHAKGAVHEIESILVFMCSVIMAGIEKITAAIEKKESNVIVGTVTEVSSIKVEK